MYSHFNSMSQSSDLLLQYTATIFRLQMCGRVGNLICYAGGCIPFEEPEEPNNFRKTIQYSIPDYVHISPESHHLISRIFVTNLGTAGLFNFGMYQVVNLLMQ
ncbi:hypothetical protein HHK36_025276 [Tetracentron sinense]|uniref:Uncharacterized protein n=1 Tax=Tetracentron sinense TaxID=13715 RepID=A0A834YKK1_TETSI|nr:hypothetical protein HHK36_025276 [Tetracentron sinense]